MASTKYLLLNEQALSELPDHQKPIFILEWLRHLESVLTTISRLELKSIQPQLLTQLLSLITPSPNPPTSNPPTPSIPPPGPPIRLLLSSNLSSLFLLGDTVSLFSTINTLNDLLKSPPSPSSPLPTLLTSLSCLSSMYSRLGRMMGRSYEETVTTLSKIFKSSESTLRISILSTFTSILEGMHSAISPAPLKEMYKICKLSLTDRSLPVRSAASTCLLQMCVASPALYTTDLETLTALCLRALDGSSYDSRLAISKLLGSLIAFTQRPPLPRGMTPRPLMLSGSSKSSATSTKPISLSEGLSILMTGFLRGSTSGHLIKGTSSSSSVNRQVRVGVTHAYIHFIEYLGPTWLERHLEPFTTHILELVANPKAATSHVDAVYSRKCVNFILRRTFGRLLSEKQQFSVIKVLSSTLTRQMNSIDFSPENAKECNQETIFNQHLLACLLQELSCLFLSLGTTMTHLTQDPTLNLLNGLFSVLIHPCQSTRLSGAWALRCLCVALPSEARRCIDRCVEGLENLKTSPEAVAGYSAALAGILGGVRKMPLGIPQNTGKIVFNLAEELLRTASQNSRLSVQRSHAGWLMIGAIMTLGTEVVKGLLPRCMLLWRNSFPRGAKELESEKQRGDAFTWQVTLEQRSGALGSIYSFLVNCGELCSEEVEGRIMQGPVEGALAMMTGLQGTLKQYGVQLKASAAGLRWRLYQTLGMIRPIHFERSYTHMLRFVIWELTLNDNVANTTTSLFTRVCQSNQIFNSLVTDHVSIEDQLQPTGAAGSGAIEHDPCALYQDLPEGTHVPLPHPLGVSVIDSSIELFGLLYPQISSKHRLQLIDHFVECLKVTKYARREAVLINIFCAILLAMRTLRKTKNQTPSSSAPTPSSELGPPLNMTTATATATSPQSPSPPPPSSKSAPPPGAGGIEELKQIASLLVTSSLGSPSPIIRCCAAEVLGRICQSVQCPRFTTETAVNLTSILKSGSRDVSTRTGHSLALGCLHKYLGGMDSSRHQHGSVSILLNLAQDHTSPETQVWALHSLALVADTGGPLFRSYVEPSLSLVMKLITTVSLTSVDLRQASGKMLSALITAVGPELQMSAGPEGPLKSFEIGCALLSRPEEHPLVQNEAITCYQRLHLFGGTINYDQVIPVLYRSMKGDNLLLRRSTVDCFRQLTQREAALVSKYFDKEVQRQLNEDSGGGGASSDGTLQNGGGDISAHLFGMLDMESDEVIRKGIRDTVISIFTSASSEDKGALQSCIALCKNILTCDASTGGSDQNGGGGGQGSPDDMEGDDDADVLKLGESDMGGEHGGILTQNSRWTSRVFAAELVRKILIGSPFLMPGVIKGPEMLRHLSDLIRMAFMGATSNSDRLRLEGLLNLERVIEGWAKVRDPDFPGVSILEQFQAQVGAALRPAFQRNESDPMVGATACRVCSAWICGGSEGGDNGEDLRRVSGLMKRALDKVKVKGVKGSGSSQWDFNESASTLEKLAVLKAWAEVFIKAVEGQGGHQGHQDEEGQLLKLVKPELEVLSGLWISVLRDRALIELPKEFGPQLPREGGAFFSGECRGKVRKYYGDAWAPILLASAICEARGEGGEGGQGGEGGAGHQMEKEERFFLVFGLAMEALCKQGGRGEEGEERGRVRYYLGGLEALLGGHWGRGLVSGERRLAIELCCVLHRQLVTRCDDIRVQEGVVRVLGRVIEGVRENFNKIREGGGEGDEEGDEGKSVVMSCLEVVFCLLMQKIGGLASHVSGFQVKKAGSREENDGLLKGAVGCLGGLVDICGDGVAVGIMPTVMYLTSCILGEEGGEGEKGVVGEEARGAVLGLYRKFVGHRLRGHPQWERYLLSTLVKVLDMAKTAGVKGQDEGEGGKGEEVERKCCLLSAIAIFIVREGGEGVGGQEGDGGLGVLRVPQVLYPSINMFQQCYQVGEDVKVRGRAVQLICQIFEKAEPREVRTHFIHALAPRILQWLYGEEARGEGMGRELLELVLESVRAIQILVQVVESKAKRVQMLTLIVPVLINFLLEPPSLNAPGGMGGGVGPHRKLLHDLSLQKLMKIGLQYREEFRALMSQCPEMRLKLETVIKNSKLGADGKPITAGGGVGGDGGSAENEGGSRKGSTSGSTGSIKLKTDFSNFHTS